MCVSNKLHVATVTIVRVTINKTESSLELYHIWDNPQQQLQGNKRALSHAVMVCF